MGQPVELPLRSKNLAKFAVIDVYLNIFPHCCFIRSAGNGISGALTNGEANDDFNESDTKNITRSNSKSVSGRDTSRKGRDGDKKNDKDNKDSLSLVIKLESDVKRLKCDLQLSRNRENELRDQIVSYMSSKLIITTYNYLLSTPNTCLIFHSNE